MYYSISCSTINQVDNVFKEIYYHISSDERSKNRANN